MSILDRLRRIVKANINGLLDIAEPPENELEAKIKELEEAIGQGRESAAAYGATFKRMERELEDFKQQQKMLTEDAENAVKGGDQELARKSLMKKVKLEERISQMSPGVEDGKRTFEMLRDNLIKLQEQLKSAKLKLYDLKSRKRAADAQLIFDKNFSKVNAAYSEGQAFERIEDDVLQSESEVEINAEIRGDELTDIDLTHRARDLQVEAELQNIKDKLEN